MSHCDCPDCKDSGCPNSEEQREWRRLSCSAPLTGSVSLTELEQFVEEMELDESMCLAGDHGVGFAFGFIEAIGQIRSFVQEKKQNVKHEPPRKINFA